MIRAGLCLSVALLLPFFAASAQADDASSTLGDICPDRPTKGTAPCTVPEGHFQIESDLVNDSIQNDAGVHTETLLVTNPTLKYGIADNLDVELNASPYVEVLTRVGAGPTVTQSGFGDLFLHVKWHIADFSGISIALDPFLKIPTAPLGVGNGAVEGGAVVPVSIDLGSSFSLALSPELDVLKNALDDGRHIATQGSAGLNYGVTDAVTASVELWSSADFDPAGTRVASTFDLAVAWLPTPEHDWQLDTGLNLGLNHNAASRQVYAGISKRF